MTASRSITVMRAALILLVAGAVIAFGFSANNYLLQAGTTLAMSAVLCFAWNVVGGFMGYPSCRMQAFRSRSPGLRLPSAARYLLRSWEVSCLVCAGTISPSAPSRWWR